MRWSRTSGLALALFMVAATASWSRRLGAEDTTQGGPFVVSSALGRHYFRMEPDPDGLVDASKATGAVYAVGLSGSDLMIWTTSGWYAEHPQLLWLSSDGERLARFRICHSARDSALTIYGRSGVLAGYALSELVENPDSLVHDSQWGYVFLDLSRPPSFNGDRLEVQLKDGSNKGFSAARK